MDMELPVVVGLHVCERVVRDPATRNFSIIQRKSIFRAEEFPTTFSFSVFAIFVDGFGMKAVRVEIEHLANGLVVHEFPAIVNFPDRLREVTFGLELSEIEFWHPGEYDVSLTIDGEPMTKCKIHLLETGTEKS